MFVRLVRFAFSPDNRKPAEEMAADLIPAIADRPGCNGATFFGDPSTGEYGLYVLWDSKENADAAAAVIGPKLQQHLAGNAQRPAEIQLFDVLKTSTS
jgi:quinol monooxygenase YgiN